MHANDLSADEILYSAAWWLKWVLVVVIFFELAPKTSKVRSINRFVKEFYKQVTHNKLMDKPLE